jgi:hypothetical protein
LFFKEKEKGGESRSPLCGQWKEKEKVPMLRGQWKEKEKVPMLGGQWNVKEKIHFHLFPLSPQLILLKPSIFSFDFKVLLYHGSKPLLTHFLLFFIYKLRLRISM